MLSFFPTPYQDEILYSVTVRYHLRSGNRIFKQTMLELLGYSSQQACNFDLPNNVEHLVRSLPVGSAYLIDYFIGEHTLYPFYKSFLTSPELWLLKDRMRSKLNGSISDIAKIPSVSASNNQRFLKFCSACLEQDIEKYGEAYWHRMHQVPGRFVCLEHNEVLLDSSIEIEKVNSHYYPATLENCLYGTKSVSYPSPILQHLVQLAKDIEFLMMSNFDFRGLCWMRQRYQNYLIRHDFIEVYSNTNIKFNQQKFLNSVLDFYSPGFWKIVTPEVAQRLGKYLHYCLLSCDLIPTIDRVTHIILIRFLAGSMEDFFAIG